MKLRALLTAAVLVTTLLVPVALAPVPTAALQLNQPVVGMAATPTGKGCWQVARDGGMFTFGDAPFLGSTGSIRLNSPIVGMAATPSGGGYWLVAADGGIFTFGDAPFLGSTGSIRLNSPIVGMAATPSGAGYWLVARDGGIFTFGDAAFLGSTGHLRLNAPIVGMAPSPGGTGYRLVATDGGIFTFGDADFLGSTGAIRLNSPVVGMAATPSGRGYWLVARDGGIFTFGDAAFAGSAGSIVLNEPIVGMAPSPSGRGYWLVAADGGVFTFGDAGFFGSPQEPPAPSPAPAPRPPNLTVTAIVTGLTIPWDLAFTPDGTMLFTERPGRLSARLPDGTTRLLADISSSLFVSGETGLMGLAVDPGFGSNRTIYTCQTNASPREVRVVKWTVAADYTSATRTVDPLVGGIPSTSTVHNGCRPRFGPDGLLYVGTGDSAQGPMPQSDGLGGKVLRVDPTTGATAIHTRGHRNVQGLAVRPGTGQLYSVEHGPDRDDEVNLLAAGGNAGWDPVGAGGSYNQSVPMTDLNKFPSAIRARWSSGSPTIATSGATFVTGSQWGTWDGALVVACLKASKLETFFLDEPGNIVGQQSSVTTFGRLRTPVQGPDGNLYVTTSVGGGNDRILRVVPS